MPMKAYVTLRDIAVKAQVSVTCVGRALNDRDDIGEDTKARIRAIAAELGYVRHAAASDLRSGASRSIGVIVTHIDNAFFSPILQGIGDCVSEHGYTVLMLSSNEDVESERAAIDLLASYRVSGMLITPANDLESDIDYSAIQAPHIEIVRSGARAGGNYFRSDSRRGGELAAQGLAAAGKRRLAYLGFSRPVSCDRERRSGFAGEAARLGLDFPEGRSRACDAGPQAAFEAMAAWIEEGFDADGLFAYNDVMAMGALRALADAGIEVPGEVSVIGHDDIEVAQSLVPRLSTIRVPKYRLGFESARALLDQMATGGGEEPRTQVLYEPELVLRET